MSGECAHVSLYDQAVLCGMEFPSIHHWVVVSARNPPDPHYFPLFHSLVRGCVVQAPAYALSLNYAGCLASRAVLFFLKWWVLRSHLRLCMTHNECARASMCISTLRAHVQASCKLSAPRTVWLVKVSGATLAAPQCSPVCFVYMGEQPQPACQFYTATVTVLLNLTRSRALQLLVSVLRGLRWLLELALLFLCTLRPHWTEQSCIRSRLLLFSHLASRSRSAGFLPTLKHSMLI